MIKKTGKVTIWDVAKEAQVSKSTVSLVLTNSGSYILATELNTETIEKRMLYLLLLNYDMRT